MIPILIAHAAFLPERRDHVAKMLEAVPTARVIESPEKVHARVWFRRVVEVAGDGPFCMLNDDVDVCPDFQRVVDSLHACAPDRLIALHTTAAAAPSLIMCGEQWLTSYWMTGPGMIIPSAARLAEWMDRLPAWIWHSQNEDGVLNQYAWWTGVPVLHCLPAVVKHVAEIPSTLGYDNHPMRVTEVYGEPPAFWKAPDKPVYVACPWMSEAQLAHTEAAIAAHRDPPKVPSIAFASPSKGGAYTTEYVQSLWQTGLRVKSAELTWIKMAWLHESVDIIRARARFQDTFLTQTDCSILMWVDDDMQWTPATIEAVAREVHGGKDVVGVPYPQKSIHWDRVEAAVSAGRHPETFTSNYPVNMLAHPEGDGDCCTVQSIGMGMLAFSRRAVAAIVDEAMHHDMDSGEWFYDHQSTRRIANSFGFKVDERGQLLSDSHTICWRWRRLAGKLPFADGRVWMYAGEHSPVNHVGKHVYKGYAEGVIGQVIP